MNKIFVEDQWTSLIISVMLKETITIFMYILEQNFSYDYTDLIDGLNIVFE
jgi:hypothetical protein